MFVYITDKNTNNEKILDIHKRLTESDKDLVLTKDGSGRPLLNEGYISISHSGEYKVMAISSKKVGIDIEKHRDINFQRIVSRFFKDTRISSLNDFFGLWVKNEAYLKFTGEGLKKLGKKNNYNKSRLYTFIEGYSMAIYSDDKKCAFCFI